MHIETETSTRIPLSFINIFSLLVHVQLTCSPRMGPTTAQGSIGWPTNKIAHLPCAATRNSYAMNVFTWGGKPNNDNNK